ncbi:MAG: plastocyanin/azurin family copper-binding protein [Candidatus Nitrosocosmicus sp.]|nr:plastocyanin/azurin family copper-binding protein [Candidatus Nitrosocosmicus sp.]MDR4491857.1 plastocyanin/azurin family copper-binding protein [Candidatus Nitrosocosmicus sp.]HET8792617.1 plastocyanin/azurin family copper-binding protein [Nitrososphaeraceae archaeon]
MTNKIIYLSVSLITFVGLLAIGLNVNLDKAFAQGDKVAVSIVPGSSSLTKNGYQPDPVQVKVGQTVVWTNNDSAFHTVTSGLPGQPDAGKLFDSGLQGPTAMTGKGKTFEHTFDTAGEFDYHCALHPALVGKVIVS